MDFGRVAGGQDLRVEGDALLSGPSPTVSRTRLPSMADCYPAPDTWDDLRTDLMPGEKTLARRLIRELGEDWRIYLQPALAGTRPDIVLVHPRAGVQVLEVKDINLGAYDLSGRRWQVDTGDGLHSLRDPFAQADSARDALFRVLLPAAGEAREENSKHYGFARAGVFFTNAEASDLQRVRAYQKRRRGRASKFYGLAGKNLGPRCGNSLEDLIPLLGYEDRGNPHVDAVASRARAAGMERPWQEVLHGWLHPTPDEIAQNEPLTLTASQGRAARSPAHQLLITGPAGSGKTAVLARRAARALVRGEDVLFLSYNITLWHYVHDVVARAVRTALAEGRQYTREERRSMGREALRRRIRRELKPRYTEAMRRLTLTHYHDVAYRLWGLLDREGTPEPDALPGHLCREAGAIRRALAAAPGALPTADRLIIDEGQDFGPRWPQSLQPLLAEDAPVAIAADSDQCIYDHAAEDPAALFPEKPTRHELVGTARVPPALLPAVNAASKQIQTGAASSPPAAALAPAPQLQLDFSGRPDPEAVWTQARPETALDVAAATARRRILDGVNPSQIAVLVDRHKIGLAVERRFQRLQMEVCSVCVPNPETDRSRKRGFWRLDSRLKISTVHSFKGWEADVVVLLLPSGAPELVHVALTRTKAVIDVIAPPGIAPPDRWTVRSGRELLPLFPPAVQGPGRASPSRGRPSPQGRAAAPPAA